MTNTNFKIDKNSKIVKFISFILVFSLVRKMGLWGGLIIIAIAVYMGIFELDTIKEMAGFVKSLFA